MKKNNLTNKIPGNTRYPKITYLSYVLLTLSILFLFYRFYMVQRNAKTTAIQNDLKSIATLKVNQIEEWRKERIGDVNSIISNKFLVKEIKNIHENKATTANSEDLKYSFETLISYYGYESIELADTKGNIFYSIPEKDYQLEDYAKRLIPEVLKTKKIYFSDFHIKDTTGKIFIDILAPVYDSDSNVKEVIIFDIDPDKFLYPNIRTWPVESKTAETLLIEEDNGSALYLNELRHIKNSALKFKLGKDKADVLGVKALNGITGITDGTDYRNVNVLGFIAPIKDTKWFMIAKIDKEEAYSDITQLNLWFSGLFTLVIICAISLFWSQIRKTRAIYFEMLYNIESEKKAILDNYEFIVENANDAIMISDPDGNLVDTNEKACKLYGYSREEILKLNIRDFRTYELREELDLTLIKVQRENGLVYESVNMKKDGTIFPVESSVRMIKMNGQNYYQAIIRDITERKKIEEALRKSEDDFRTLFDNSIMGFYRTTADGKILMVNNALVQMLGFSSADELIERNLDKEGFLSDKPRNIFLNTIFKNGEVRNFESTWIKKDGTKIYVHENAKVILGSDREILYFDGTVEDVTERRKAQEIIIEKEEKYRRLHESIMDAIVTVDMSGKLIEWNNAYKEMLGYSDEELRQKSYVDLTPEKWREFESQIVQNQILPRGYSDVYEKEYIKKDGTIFPIELRTFLLKDDTGKPSAMWGVIRDITNRKNAEEDLLKSESKYHMLFSNMLEGIALHEIIFDENKTAVNYRIIDVNNNFETFIGIKSEQAIGSIATELYETDEAPFLEIYSKVAETGIPIYFETYFEPLNKHFAISVFSPQKNMFATVFNDITERKRLEKEQDITIKLLQLLNSQGTTHNLIREVTKLFQKSFDFEAVGIRLKDGEDYPYFETQGFDSKFVEKENYLCVRNSDGEPLRNTKGFPILDCMCGNVICNRVNPEKPFFTKRGSFWTNSISKFLTTTTEADMLLYTRNRCNTAGYESLALIAIHSENITHGLLQLNDRREGKFTPESINFIERLADILANGLAYRESREILRESEESYRSLFENMVEGYAYCKMIYENEEATDWIYLSVNGAFEKLTGLKNVMGKKVSEVIPGIKESDSELFYIYSSVALSGQPVKFERYVEALKMWFSISVYSPEKEFFVAVFDVITERKLAEEQNQKLTRTYAVLSQINQAIVKAEERDVLFDEICKICVEYGKFKTAWIGLMDEKENRIHPVASAGSSEGILDIYNINKMCQCESCSKAIEIIKTNKFYFSNDYIKDFEDCNYLEEFKKRDFNSIALFPLKIEGNFIGLFELISDKKNFFDEEELTLLDEVIMDISYALENLETEKDKHRALNNLKASENKFRKVFENAKDAIVLLDGGLLVDFNKRACDMLGFSPEELLYKSPLYFSPEFQNDGMLSKDKMISHMSDVMNGKTIISEWDSVKKDGSSINVEITLNKVQIDGKDMLLGTIHDITERKKYETGLKEAMERAEEMSRLKSSFLANMSHELRTPMTGILGFAEILNDKLKNPDEREMADVILKGGKRLMNTLNQILDLSRIESDKIDLIMKPTNISDVATNTARLYEILARENNLELILKIEKNVNAILDEQLLEQVLSNMIKNAIIYTEQGSVTIEAKREIISEKEFAVIKVSDTGIGIPGALKEAIFEPFRQVSEGFSRRFEGTGLGLTISKRYIELMNGTINVESAIGEGSTFVVRFHALPGHKEIESKKVPVEEEKGEILEDTEKKVLVVEDDENSIFAINFVLKNISDADFVKNGEEAIEMAKKNKYDLILMDIGLEGISGLEATKEIRKLAGYKKTPIVAVTAFAMVGDKEKFLAGGCSHYLSKPFKISEFKKFVTDILIKK